MARRKILEAQRGDDDRGDVLLLGEVAEGLGVSRSTAYIAARAGELPVQFVRGRYEMRRADLEQLIAERQQHAAREEEVAPAT